MEALNPGDFDFRLVGAFHYSMRGISKG